LVSVGDPVDFVVTQVVERTKDVHAMIRKADFR